ncbi:MAG: PHP domain-containing protein [Erysipelothrix sp.]|nr:PHP domain-containing protein [Erysipelothrix sp.]
MIYADLHMHSNYSDGILEIEEVLAKAKEAGIQVVAMTDHDITYHYERVYKAAKDFGLQAIKGVEMSCYDYDVYKKVHVVGLYLNDYTPHVDKYCEHTLAKRDAYHAQLIEELQEQGYDINYEDAKKFSKYSIVFKMNIFQALKEKYPEEMTPQRYKELFASQTSIETDMKMGYTDVKDGIQAILKDGGIPILAHPCQYDNYEEIDKYVSYGLQGIEISQNKMKEHDYPLTKEYAKKYQLIQSGGSDFHDPAIHSFGTWGLTEEEFGLFLQDIASKK